MPFGQQRRLDAAQLAEWHGIVCMEMIILMGLQASGKSTFSRLHFASTHTYISKDLLRNNKRPERRQYMLLELALQAGHSVLIDNTNPTPADREPLIALAHHYHAQVIGYYFPAQVNKSLERNRQRIGKAQVPPVAIFATLKKLTPPVYKEGFDVLYSVSANDDFSFAVSAWSTEEKPSTE